MKKFITQTALLLALGMGVCSTLSAKPKSFHVRSSHMGSSYEQVSFIPLQTKKGFAIMVDKLQPGNSTVIIYDQNKNVVFKDCLTKNTRAEKKYILSGLNDGDYTVEVFSKTHDIKTSFYVWDNGKRKIVHMI